MRQQNDVHYFNRRTRDTFATRIHHIPQSTILSYGGGAGRWGEAGRGEVGCGGGVATGGVATVGERCVKFSEHPRMLNVRQRIDANLMAISSSV